MKALLYVKKGKPYLTRNDLPNKKGEFYKHWQLGGELDKKHLYGDTPILNGKIVAECDFEVEEIFGISMGTNQPDKYDFKWEDRILNGACLTNDQMNDYIPYYAIHIKNLHIFDKPRELNECWANTNAWIFDNEKLDTTPRNMRYCEDWNLEKVILIPISSQEACNILNHKQDILIRRNVLKEMK